MTEVDPITEMTIAELVELLALQESGPEAYIRDLRGRTIRRTKARRGGLLARLHDAVRGLGDFSATKSAPAERSLLSATAADTWTDICKDITDLYTDVLGDMPGVGQQPAHMLVAWFAGFEADFARGESDFALADAFRDQLIAMAQRIRDIVDPERSKELLIDCPLCGRARVEVEGGFEVTAVIVQYDRRFGEPMQAFCRACRQVVAAGQTEVIHVARKAGIDVDSEAASEAIRHALYTPTATPDAAMLDASG